MLFFIWMSFFMVGDDLDVDWFVFDVFWVLVMLWKCLIFFFFLNRYVVLDKIFIYYSFVLLFWFLGMMFGGILIKDCGLIMFIKFIELLNWIGVVL